ncbi:MAG: ABC transporter permease subunit [Spirochaetaceae bacterium]|nr:ABC transporter permease subunit [Spirochaetaceae bacterium]
MAGISVAARARAARLRESSLFRRFYRDRHYLALLLPGIAYFVIFQYIPIYGLQVAFKDFSFRGGILGSPWADQFGMANFIRFFSVYNVGRLIANTFLLNLYSLIFAFPVPIVLAVMLHESPSAPFRRSIQTVTYLPNFISIVAIIGIMRMMLSPGSGSVNRLLGLAGIEPIYFMIEPGWFRPLYVISGIWQTAGFGAIVYLAALASINPELYEAAIIDGTGRIQRIRHVSIPGILPVVAILFIFNMGNMLSSGFEKVLLMQHGTNLEVSDVIGTFIYRVGLTTVGNYDLATAVGLFNTVINFTLLVTANALVRRVAGTGLW